MDQSLDAVAVWDFLPHEALQRGSARGTRGCGGGNVRVEADEGEVVAALCTPFVETSLHVICAAYFEEEARTRGGVVGEGFCCCSGFEECVCGGVGCAAGGGRGGEGGVGEPEDVDVSGLVPVAEGL